MNKNQCNQIVDRVEKELTAKYLVKETILETKCKLYEEALLTVAEKLDQKGLKESAESMKELLTMIKNI